MTTSSCAPAPFTPEDCDLRDFGRMMIDITRLLGSTFNSKASRNPLAWMIGHKLWYRSWHQVPAGSLPNDDDELCYLAELGFDRTSFDSVRALALHGWVLCSDGRLYHAVVADFALDAWDRKLRQRHRTFCASIRKHNERNPQAKQVSPSYDDWFAASGHAPVTRDNAGHVTQPSREKPLQGTGTGTGTLRGEESLPGAIPIGVTTTRAHTRGRARGGAA